MPLSIRWRMILAMNLLVAAVGSAVGYVGIEAATSQVAQRLVQESARNAADLFSAQSWPLDSDALMAQSAKLLGAETACLPRAGRSSHRRCRRQCGSSSRPRSRPTAPRRQ
jgi:hypothetical protein